MARVEPTQSSLPTDGSAKRVSFKYDYLGRRIEKVVETWTAGSPNSWVVTKHRRFVWDGWLMLLELDALNSNAVVRKYTWGLDLGGLAGGAAGGRAALDGAGGIGGLLAVDVQAADPDTAESGAFWFTYDANGNVMELVAGATGYGGATADEWHADRLVGRYEYDPYGNLVNTPSAFALTNSYRFSTKPWDDDTGLGYWGERYYDARLGRWINHDPIGEAAGAHLYSFSDNGPTIRYDALGLLPVGQATCGGGTGGSGEGTCPPGLSSIGPSPTGGKDKEPKGGGQPGSERDGGPPAGRGSSCGCTIKRSAICTMFPTRIWDYGHEWIDCGQGGVFDFPAGWHDKPCQRACPSPPVREWNVHVKPMGGAMSVNGQRISCSKATCAQIRACLAEQMAKWRDYNFVFNNCITFVDGALNKCCMSRGALPTRSPGPFEEQRECDKRRECMKKAPECQPNYRPEEAH